VAAYLWRHRTARDPLVPRGLMVARARGGPAGLIPSLLVSVLVGVALVAIVVDIPLFARLTVTDSQIVAALLLVRFLVALPVGAFVGGWLLTAVGLRRYNAAVAVLPDQASTPHWLPRGSCRCKTVFLGGAIAARIAAGIAMTLGGPRSRGSGVPVRDPWPGHG